MVPVMSLWLPIILASVIVFLASFIMHMVLTYHRADYRPVPNEDQVMEALRRANISPGNYMMPCGSGPADMKNPAFIEKMKKGPVAMLNVLPSGPPRMGSSLAQWFFFTLLVGVFAAYVTGRALGPGHSYREVFRFAGTAAFMGYGLGHMTNSIWMGRSWGATFRSMFDGLVYALLTAGTFGWLWPR
jgi:hypothetical protein